MEMEKQPSTLEEKVDVLRTDTDDLIEVVHSYAEKIDRRFDTLEEKIATLPTRTEMRELVQDVVDRSWEKALAKIKQVDMHVDATVDTLAGRQAITGDDRRTLHAMQPFPKLVKET